MKLKENETFNVYQELNVKIPSELKDFIKEYKDTPGNLIIVLHKIQEIYGYIPRKIAMQVAKDLDIHLAKIYGVATFYHFFKLEKPGEHKISVCTGTACYLKGAPQIIEELEKLLSVKAGETTEDGKFTLETVRCIGCCGLAPVITIDDKTYGNLTKEQIPKILKEYQEK